MRKANKQSTTLLPQERFINLLNKMVDDMDWDPFGIYGEDYHFSYSDNPEFPYRLTYTKHDQEFHIDLSENMIFAEDSSFTEELLYNHMLDVNKFDDEVDLRIDFDYKILNDRQYFSEEDPLTWSVYFQNNYHSNKLEELFKYLIEG